MTHSDYKSRKARAERAKVIFEMERNAHTAPTQLRRSRYGFSPTTSDLTTTEVNLRRASNAKTTRKPSMPKMPWGAKDTEV